MRTSHTGVNQQPPINYSNQISRNSGGSDCNDCEDSKDGGNASKNGSTEQKKEQPKTSGVSKFFVKLSEVSGMISNATNKRLNKISQFFSNNINLSAPQNSFLASGYESFIERTKCKKFFFFFIKIFF